MTAWIIIQSSQLLKSLLRRFLGTSLHSMHSELVFNASTIATLQVPDPAFLTASEGRAGARAILRHKLHTEGNMTVMSGINGGLPPLYKELHGDGSAKGKELQGIRLVLKESFRDLLNAVSTNVIPNICSY